MIFAFIFNLLILLCTDLATQLIILILSLLLIEICGLMERPRFVVVYARRPSIAQAA